MQTHPNARLATTQTAAADSAAPSLWRTLWQTFAKNRGALVGFALFLGLIIAALFASVLAPHDPLFLNNGKEQLPPAWMAAGDSHFLLGTDDASRDTLSRMLYGARYSLFIGLTATLLSLVVGIFLGLAAAFWPKWIGGTIMRVTDIMMSYPSLLLAVMIAAILGPNMQNTILTIAIVELPPFIKLTRASALVELSKDYVTAARVVGVGVMRRMFVTVLPNCSAPLIVQATLGFSSAILEAGAIGFLGFGVQPPEAEWGAMLGSARQYIQSNVWLAIFPGFAVFLSCLSINLIGDGLRDALDPKLKVMD